MLAEISCSEGDFRFATSETLQYVLTEVDAALCRPTSQMLLGYIRLLINKIIQLIIGPNSTKKSNQSSANWRHGCHKTYRNLGWKLEL